MSRSVQDLPAAQPLCHDIVRDYFDVQQNLTLYYAQSLPEF